MKKLIFIVLCLFFLACNQYIVKNVYQMKYTSENLATIDIYKQLNIYGIDSIPLNRWMTNKIGYDSVKIEQYLIRKIIDVDTEYDFIYTRCYQKGEYDFIIRYRGKK